jgi:hypothetical protein
LIDQPTAPTAVEEQNLESSDTSNQSPSSENEKAPDDQPIKFITNIFENTKKPKSIRIDLNNSQSYQEEYKESFGNLPVLYYNSYQIEYTDIKSLELSFKQNLPSLSVAFGDTLGKIGKDGMPLDDSTISIFLNPRTKFLKPIHMDFKIVDFDKNGTNYEIFGVIDINDLYLRKFQSYKDMTSFELYQKVAKECGLGFNTNIDNTNDKMTWINTGRRVYEFINDSIESSYKSDETFLTQYIDYYYNLNMIDIEKEYRRDVSKDINISNTGIEELIKNSKNPDTVGSDYLTNDFSLKQSNIYFEEYKLINNSTRNSLKRGYLTRLKFYNELSKEFLEFDVDALTSESDKKISLRGAPRDDSFFKKNVNYEYDGYIDTDNCHVNYSYAKVQNKINYNELDKISIICLLPTPNYNLYKFKKIYLIVSNNKSSPGYSLFNPRLTGEWIICDISFTFISGKFKQKVELVRRDLSLSDEEISAELSTKKSVSQEPTQSQENENPQ